MAARVSIVGGFGARTSGARTSSARASGTRTFGALIASRARLGGHRGSGAWLKRSIRRNIRRNTGIESRGLGLGRGTQSIQILLNG